MCDVFFFGTARRIDSQIPSSNEGIEGRLSWIAGIERTNEGSRGRESCRDNTRLVLGVDDTVAGMSLERNAEPAGAIRRDGAANAISNVGVFEASESFNRSCKPGVSGVRRVLGGSPGACANRVGA
jgi:hypothetical protein